jgi:DNA-directed RNA polymerase subunit RPC12/RpoP
MAHVLCAGTRGWWRIPSCPILSMLDRIGGTPGGQILARSRQPTREETVESPKSAPGRVLPDVVVGARHADARRRLLVALWRLLRLRLILRFARSLFDGHGVLLRGPSQALVDLRGRLCRPFSGERCRPAAGAPDEPSAVSGLGRSLLKDASESVVTVDLGPILLGTGAGASLASCPLPRRSARQETRDRACPYCGSRSVVGLRSSALMGLPSHE